MMVDTSCSTHTPTCLGVFALLIPLPRRIFPQLPIRPLPLFLPFYSNVNLVIEALTSAFKTAVLSKHSSPPYPTLFLCSHNFPTYYIFIYISYLFTLLFVSSIRYSLVSATRAGISITHRGIISHLEIMPSSQ